MNNPLHAGTAHGVCCDDESVTQVYRRGIAAGPSHKLAANFPAFLAPEKFGKFGKFDYSPLPHRPNPGTAKRRQVPRLRASLVGVC
jgi:hypothetical protein